jgi:uncharacterized protein (DUF433 family)
MLGFDRITFDPKKMAGQACIRDIRVPVSLILNLIANGKTTEEIIEDYPYLEAEDIQQSLQYAAWLASERVYWAVGA